MVEFLQNLLQKLGFYQGKIDGVFGNNTYNAVLHFQRNFGLVPDGIVGEKTWKMLSPYINGGLNFVVPTNISYSSSILEINLNTLKKLYPFIEVGSIGKSVLGKQIQFVKVGKGEKEVFYSASYHANEWITSVVMMKFLSDFCYAYKNNLNIFNAPARQIFETTSIYIVPMVNPDGVDLVTGEIVPNSELYAFASQIASNFPQVPFTSGWKANIRGVDLNLQFPALWEMAKEIKYSQGYYRPAPRDFVGYRSIN